MNKNQLIKVVPLTLAFMTLSTHGVMAAPQITPQTESAIMNETDSLGEYHNEALEYNSDEIKDNDYSEHEYNILIKTDIEDQFAYIFNPASGWNHFVPRLNRNAQRFSPSGGNLFMIGQHSRIITQFNFHFNTDRANHVNNATFGSMIDKTHQPRRMQPTAWSTNVPRTGLLNQFEREDGSFELRLGRGIVANRGYWLDVTWSDNRGSVNNHAGVFNVNSEHGPFGQTWPNQWETLISVRMGSRPNALVEPILSEDNIELDDIELNSTFNQMMLYNPIIQLDGIKASSTFGQRLSYNQVQDYIDRHGIMPFYIEARGIEYDGTRVTIIKSLLGYTVEDAAVWALELAELRNFDFVGFTGVIGLISPDNIETIQADPLTIAIETGYVVMARSSRIGFTDIPNIQSFPSTSTWEMEDQGLIG